MNKEIPQRVFVGAIALIVLIVAIFAWQIFLRPQPEGSLIPGGAKNPTKPGSIPIGAIPPWARANGRLPSGANMPDTSF